jgi:hypothetical protein
MITTSKRCAVRMAAPIALALALALAGSADRVSGQYLGGGTMTAAQAQVADLEQVRDKFVALAGAFPDSTYDWRPMEGVRSVRQVFTLVAEKFGQLPAACQVDPDVSSLRSTSTASLQPIRARW